MKSTKRRSLKEVSLIVERTIKQIKSKPRTKDRIDTVCKANNISIKHIKAVARWK